MFTGIIEEIGIVKSIVRQSNSIKLTVSAKKILSDIHIGDSISTNGICLTVTNFNNDSYTVDVMPETMMTTNFKNLKINDKLNLERALPVNGRLGGHIVSGHIDGIGTIVRKYKDDKAIRMSFSTSSDILGLIVKKGSIAIDGISLTITEVDSTSFSVSLPKRLIATTYGRLYLPIFSICFCKLAIPANNASTFSQAKSAFSTPPCIFNALIVATITTHEGCKSAFLHLISKNFSAPKSAPKPASVTT